MSSTKGATGAALLQDRMQHTFGLNHRQYLEQTHRGPVPRAYLGNAIRIVERSGVLPKMQEWRQLARKSNAGSKPIIPLQAVLILFLLNVQMGLGVTYHQIASTLDVRFGPEDFALLGIRDVPGDHADWYQRIWQAANRMLSLIDPYPAPRNHLLPAEEYQQLLARMATPEALTLSQRNLKRIDWICNQLVVASVRALPRDIWDKYDGNIAIDATKADITGRTNPTDAGLKRSNPDPLSRRYRREDKHDGQGASTDVAAYELETAVMAWNAPGENAAFPSLITAVSFHDPGALIGHGIKLIKSHQELGFHRIIVMADRAYNGEQIDNFHIPARLLGCELVVDYRSNEVGVQGYFDDLIMLDGNWHVNWMPTDLIDATKNLVQLAKSVERARAVLRADGRNKKAAVKRRKPKVTADPEAAAAAAAKAAEIAATKEREVIEARETIAGALATEAGLRKQVETRAAYRMVPKGFPDVDGFQRFMYPTGAGDLTSHKEQRDRKSITVPMLIPVEKSKSAKKVKTQPIKFLQKFPYRTELWERYYGTRNLVESSNNLLKLASAEDIGTAAKRSGRGYAFHYLAMTLASVSSNLRRIVTFFEEEAARTTVGPLHRARYRKDPQGSSLPRHEGHGALAPPR